MDALPACGDVPPSPPVEDARRYRLVELFLVQVLHLEPDEAAHEADVLEHAVSARLLERIDALLGRPDRDLRGNSIPRSLAPALT